MNITCHTFDNLSLLGSNLPTFASSDPQRIQSLELKIHSKYAELVTQGRFTIDEIPDLHLIVRAVGVFGSDSLIDLLVEHRGLQPLGELAQAALKYERNFPALLKSFKAETLDLLRDCSEKIDTIFSILARDNEYCDHFCLSSHFFRENLDTIVDGFERYKKMYVYVLAKFEEQVFSLQGAHYKALDVILKNAKEPCLTLLTISSELFTRFPEEVVELSDLCNGEDAVLFSYLSHQMIRDSRAAVFHITKKYGQDAGAILNLASRCSVEAIELHYEALDTLRKVCAGTGEEALFRQLLPYIDERHLRDRLSTLCDLVELIQEDAPETMKAISDSQVDLLITCPRVLLELAQFTESKTSSVLQELTFKQFVANPDIYLKIARLMGSRADEILRAIPSGLERRYPLELVNLIRCYGINAIGLLLTFKRMVFNEVEARREVIDSIVEIAGDGASDIFKNIPPDEWQSEKIKFFEEAAGRVYCKETKWGRIEDAVDQETLQVNHRRFNMRHFYRYLDSSDPSWLLRENVKNLDIDYRPERPIIVYGVARHCWNGALSSGQVEVLRELTKFSRVFFGELDSVDELLVQVISAASLFGVTEEGTLVRPVHGVFVNAHSWPRGSQLSEKSPPLVRLNHREEKLLDFNSIEIENRDAFLEMGCYMEKGGFFGLLGCETAVRVEGDDSLADGAKSQLPHVNVIGTKAYISSAPGMSSHIIKTDDSGRVADLFLRPIRDNLRWLPAT